MSIAVPLSSVPSESSVETTDVWLWLPRTQLRLSLLAGAMLITGVICEFWIGWTWARVLIWASLAIGFVYGLRAALDAIREWKVDIDVLMVVGAGLAAAIGHPAEGALLLFLFTLSGALEDLALARTKREIEALHKLMPTEAIVWRDGAWIEIVPESIIPGDKIKVRPGERVPADATILAGESSLDQSTLTGESLPRSVAIGDSIFAGTVNLDNAIEAQVVRSAKESSLQKILNLVTEAREQREPFQRLIDRLGEPYAWGVMATSLAVLLIWWLGLGRSGADAAYTAITFLIVMSPCALILATPTATLSAIARGARAGVLFKGGQSIERLSRVGAVCLDKTGTLTFGRASLMQVHPVGWSDGKRLLAVAAGLEVDSTHPIAKAVREGAVARGVDPVVIPDSKHIPGRGVSGIYEGDVVAVGSIDFVEEHIPICLRARVREVVARIQQRGQLASVAVAGGDHGAAAVLIISDEVRPGAEQMVRELHALGIKPVRMLTGDNSTTASLIAHKLNLDQWDADLLPEDKVRIVREMRESMAATPGTRKYPGVAFIGDGVNDAPALASADVAIAIGSIGSDAALESADIVLLSDDLNCVPWSIALARRSRSILRFNIAMAMGVIVLMGLATLIGSRLGFEVPMSIGVIAHEGGTLAVVANSLRLLWSRGVSTGPGEVHAADTPAASGSSPA